MPVITRSQNKNIAKGKELIAPLVSEQILFRTRFINEIKDLLYCCEINKNSENKMKIALKIYTKINKELLRIVAVEGLERWIRFLAVVFNKSSEFIQDKNLGSYININKNLVEKFFEEINQTRNYLSDMIKNYNGLVISPIISEAKSEISRLENSRPCRNIKRINYTGMDMIEPENEFDKVTDIWADQTIKEDPDYDPSEDKDDEDVEFSTVLNYKEKAELKEHMSNLVDNHRVKRNIARVNYAGMDMSDEDNGEICISKRWFENGKVKYIWKRYALSMVNEIEDEDYTEQ